MYQSASPPLPWTGLARLEQLQLAHNEIDAVVELAQLGSLAVLGLGHNLVRGDGMQLPVSLRALYLEHNQIGSLAPLPPLPQLQLLDASHNQVRDRSNTP